MWSKRRDNDLAATNQLTSNADGCTLVSHELLNYKYSSLIVETTVKVNCYCLYIKTGLNIMYYLYQVTFEICTLKYQRRVVTFFYPLLIYALV